MAEKRKILIVEDDFILYDELVDFFESKGFSILGFEDGRAVDNYDDACKLLMKHTPFLSILDINIKGEKDGLEIAAFIRKHYNMPIVFLSAHNNHENVDRAIKLGGDAFLKKAEKPVDLEQLWLTVQMELPRYEMATSKKTLGSFFRVKEMLITKEMNRQRVFEKEQDPVELEVFLKWEDIVFIESYNNKIAGTGNNNLLLHTMDANRGYVMRGSLNDLEHKLPGEFARFDQSTVVNIRKIKQRNKNRTVYFVDDLSFKLSETYRQKTLEKIHLYMDMSGGEEFKE